MSVPLGAEVTVAPSAVVSPSAVGYAGLATRAVSFAIDAVVINVVATVAGVGAALILSLLHLPHPVRTILVVLGGIAYVLWLVGYFAVFWSATGQMPGARMMQIRVLVRAGATPGLARALARCAGVVLAAMPLFAGFLPVLFE